MRITTRKSWVLAGVSLAGCAASKTKETRMDVVRFNPNEGFTRQTTGIQGQPAVIWETTTIRWDAVENTIVSSVNLHINTTEVSPSSLHSLAKNSKIVGSWSRPNLSVGVAPRGDDIALETPTSYPINLAVEVSSTGGSVGIYDIWPIVNLYPSVMLELLYFDINWEKGGKKGKSYSRLFATVSPNSPPDITRLGVLGSNALLNNTEPVFHEEEPDREASGGDDHSAGVGKPTESSSTTARAALATPTNDGQTSSGEKPTNSKSDKKDLSIGAIVGIAIACGLVGLALIGAIVFCCLRRRQKQNALGGGVSRDGMPYRGSGRNGDELMAEKEANAGVLHDVTSVPQSPYSDDGHNHQQHLMGMGDVGTSNRDNGSVVMPNIGTGVSAHGVLPGVDTRLGGDEGSPVSNATSHHMHQQQIQHNHQSGRSYTMYSDHQSGECGGSPTTLHSGGGAPSLTHGGAGTESNRGSLISQQQQGRGLSTPYAHLVEEGMTEEQIRTLEEEERHLDAAIEQHASGQRGSRNL